MRPVNLRARRNSCICIYSPTQDDRVPLLPNTAIKHERVRELGEIRDSIADDVRAALLPIGAVTEVLFETYEDGYAKGHTANFIEVKAKAPHNIHGQIHKVKILNNKDSICIGEII